MKEVGCGLVGAGAAFLTTGNKKLALALVASGVALCWKGGKRPASKATEQRPQKSHQKIGGKDQPTTDGEAAHQKESRAGTMTTNLLASLGGSSVGQPGLRAFRVRGSCGSHGDEESQASASTMVTRKGKGKLYAR